MKRSVGCDVLDWILYLYSYVLHKNFVNLWFYKTRDYKFFRKDVLKTMSVNYIWTHLFSTYFPINLKNKKPYFKDAKINSINLIVTWNIISWNNFLVVFLFTNCNVGNLSITFLRFRKGEEGKVLHKFIRKFQT